MIEVNALQKRRVVAKLKDHLGGLRGTRVALLGLTFKPDTDDLREAASIVLAARLRAEGAAVTAYDPMVAAGTHELFPGVEICAGAEAALADADAVVLVTEWAEFRELDWTIVRTAMRGTQVMDGRNVLDREAVLAAGLAYDGVGIADDAHQLDDLKA